jgi:hypothetical protein
MSYSPRTPSVTPPVTPEEQITNREEILERGPPAIIRQSRQTLEGEREDFLERSYVIWRPSFMDNETMHTIMDLYNEGLSGLYLKDSGIYKIREFIELMETLREYISNEEEEYEMPRIDTSLENFASGGIYENIGELIDWTSASDYYDSFSEAVRELLNETFIQNIDEHIVETPVIEEIEEEPRTPDSLYNYEETKENYSEEEYRNILNQYYHQYNVNQRDEGI